LSIAFRSAITSMAGNTQLAGGERLMLCEIAQGSIVTRGGRPHVRAGLMPALGGGVRKKWNPFPGRVGRRLALAGGSLAGFSSPVGRWKLKTWPSRQARVLRDGWW